VFIVVKVSYLYLNIQNPLLIIEVMRLVAKAMKECAFLHDLKVMAIDYSDLE